MVDNQEICELFFTHKIIVTCPFIPGFSQILPKILLSFIAPTVITKQVTRPYAPSFYDFRPGLLPKFLPIIQL